MIVAGNRDDIVDLDSGAEEVLTKVFPEMEMLFVNQNMKLRELKLEFDTRINALADFRKNALKEDLLDFKKQFTF